MNIDSVKPLYSPLSAVLLDSAWGSFNRDWKAVKGAKQMEILRETLGRKAVEVSGMPKKSQILKIMSVQVHAVAAMVNGILGDVAVEEGIRLGKRAQAGGEDIKPRLTVTRKGLPIVVVNIELPGKEGAREIKKGPTTKWFNSFDKVRMQKTVSDKTFHRALRDALLAGTDIAISCDLATMTIFLFKYHTATAHTIQCQVATVGMNDQRGAISDIIYFAAKHDLHEDPKVQGDVKVAFELYRIKDVWVTEMMRVLKQG